MYIKLSILNYSYGISTLTNSLSLTTTCKQYYTCIYTYKYTYIVCMSRLHTQTNRLCTFNPHINTFDDSFVNPPKNASNPRASTAMNTQKKGAQQPTYRNLACKHSTTLKLTHNINVKQQLLKTSAINYLVTKFLQNPFRRLFTNLEK